MAHVEYGVVRHRRRRRRPGPVITGIAAVVAVDALVLLVDVLVR